MKGPDAPCGKDEAGETILPCPKANPQDPNEPVRCPETCPNDPKEVKTRFCNNAGSLCPETDENCPSCSRRDETGNKTCKTCKSTPGEGPKDECTQPKEITDGPTIVAVGVNATYQATGPQGTPCFAWTGGDDPATATGPSYTTKWTTVSTAINDKEVEVSGDESWGAKRKVTVVGVTFDDALIRTGYLIGSSDQPIWITSSLTCSPASMAGNVTLALTGRSTVTVSITGADTITGRVNFKVGGISPSTDKYGDAIIQAKIGEIVCGSTKAVTIVPKRIRRTFTTSQGRLIWHHSNGAVAPEYILVGRDTSPALYDGPVGQVAMAKVWGRRITVTVEDQFHDVLDEIYEDAFVEEFIPFSGGIQFAINQKLSENGTYEDPVGLVRLVFSPDGGGPVYVLPDSEQANDWTGGNPGSIHPDAPDWKIPTGINSQRIVAKVGGHLVIPHIRRNVIGTSPDNLEIRWPPSLK